MDTFETILEKHPLDPYALHMAYFLALTTGVAPSLRNIIQPFEGHTSRMRDTPKSVVKHYKPSTPFYGNVHGKLSFGQSEMGEFQVVCPRIFPHDQFLGWGAERETGTGPLPP